MTPRIKIIIAYGVLALIAGATVIIGLLFHFSKSSVSFEPWISPLCLLTGLSAPIASHYIRSKQAPKSRVRSERSRDGRE
jgi:hypothetical protein